MPGPISAATLGVHFPSTDGRLISGPSLPLVPTPRFQRTIATTIHLATVASATHQSLATTAGAKKKPAIGVLRAAGGACLVLLQHSPPRLAGGRKRRAPSSTLAAFCRASLRPVSRQRCASPANQPTCACSPVKKLLLAMLAHDCGAAGAFLTASARYGIREAGRGAGTGAPTEHRNNRWRKRVGLKRLRHSSRRRLCTLFDSHLQRQRSFRR